MSQREVKAHSKESQEMQGEVDPRSEARAMDYVLGENMRDEDLCNVYGSSSIDSWNKYTFLG